MGVGPVLGSGPLAGCIQVLAGNTQAEQFECFGGTLLIQSRRVTSTEILSNVVFRNIRLGGVLLNSVNEFLSLEQGDDVLVAVEATPTFGGRFSQLEHHNQARFSIATALRFSMS